MLRIEALPAHDRALVVAELVPLRLWWSGCAAKRAHREVGAALAECARMTRETGWAYEVYPCEQCGAFHICGVRGTV